MGTKKLTFLFILLTPYPALICYFCFMKKIIFFFCFISMLFSANAQEQRFSAGIKAGLSSSQVSGDELSGFDKAGSIAGLFVNATFTKKWSARFELLYIQKGSKYKAHPELGDTKYYRLQLNYLEVPVAFQYHFKKWVIEAGPGFGYLINNKEETEMGNITVYRPFHKSELSYIAGFDYRIFNNFSVNCRYSNSILSIRSHESGAHTFSNPGQRNSVLELTLNYTFHAKK
jgi:hypothetical protein